MCRVCLDKRDQETLPFVPKTLGQTLQHFVQSLFVLLEECLFWPEVYQLPQQVPESLVYSEQSFRPRFEVEESHLSNDYSDLSNLTMLSFYYSRTSLLLIQRSRFACLKSFSRRADRTGTRPLWYRLLIEHSAIPIALVSRLCCVNRSYH